MSSFEQAGWKEKDRYEELKEIKDSYAGLSYNKILRIDKEEANSALGVATFFYLDSAASNDVKKIAFQLCELLEFLLRGTFNVAISIIEELISENCDFDDHELKNEILDYFISKFQKYNIEYLQNTNATFFSYHGNTVYSTDLKIIAHSGSKEAVDFLLFCNAFVRSPYDFIDCASFCTNYNFSNIEEYFDYLAKNNAKKEIKDQLERGDIKMEFINKDETLREYGIYKKQQ